MRGAAVSILPPAPDPDLIIVVALVLTGFALMGLIAAWAEERLSWISVGVLVLTMALFVWVWDTDRAGWGWMRIPEAVVEVVARVLS